MANGMLEVIIPFLLFFSLVLASLGSLLIYKRLPLHHRDEETHATVKLATNLFVVMTSLVLGLMISTAKGTFESIERNVHTFATDLIVLDRSLSQYGQETNEARQRLVTYIDQELTGTWSGKSGPSINDVAAERLLIDVGNSLRSIKPKDSDQLDLWRDLLERFQKVTEQRWVVAEQSEGTIPSPLIIVVVVWLVLIFASFGYRAPRNIVVVGVLVVAAALVSGAIYLILDMDAPFSGPIQVSSAPLQRVIDDMQQ